MRLRIRETLDFLQMTNTCKDFLTDPISKEALKHKINPITCRSKLSDEARGFISKLTPEVNKSELKCSWIKGNNKKAFYPSQYCDSTYLRLVIFRRNHTALNASVSYTHVYVCVCVCGLSFFFFFWVYWRLQTSFDVHYRHLLECWSVPLLTIIKSKGKNQEKWILKL